MAGYKELWRSSSDRVDQDRVLRLEVLMLVESRRWRDGGMGCGFVGASFAGPRRGIPGMQSTREFSGYRRGLSRASSLLRKAGRCSRVVRCSGGSFFGEDDHGKLQGTEGEGGRPDAPGGGSAQGGNCCGDCGHQEEDAEYGITVGTWAVATRKPRPQIVAAKYRNPAGGETWSGRGRMPKWLAAEVAKGRKREEFWWVRLTGAKIPRLATICCGVDGRLKSALQPPCPLLRRIASADFSKAVRQAGDGGCRSGNLARKD